MKLALPIFCFLFSIQAFSTVREIPPGGSIIVEAKETVTVSCSDSNTTLFLCDCVSDQGAKYGEAVGVDGSDLRRQCVTQYVDLQPSNCKRKTGPVVCDCVNARGAKYGEAIGADGNDLRNQCVAQYVNLQPSNCR